MKKTLVALAVMAAAGAASAQSSVTLFGIVDAAITYGRGETADRLQMNSGAYNSSRLGFRGVEDLGGGLQAGFWLEAGFDPTSGVNNTGSILDNQAAASTGSGLIFGRRSTVSLLGNFGEIRLGRDVVPQHWANVVYDPFGIVGVGASHLHVLRGAAHPTSARASNSIGYFLPRNLGGFYGQVMYHLGENLRTGPTEDDGSGWGVRLGYAAGPLDVSAAYARAEQTATATIGDTQAMNIGASWNLGFGKIQGMWGRDRFDTTVGERDITGWVVGGLVPVGSGEIRLAYSTAEDERAAGTPEARKVALGYVHNLSKRTALYTTVAHLRNRNGGVATLGGASNLGNPNGNSTGFDLGVRHTF